MRNVRHITVLLRFGGAFQPIQRRRCLEQIDVLSIPLETRAEYARRSDTTRGHQRRTLYEREQDTRAWNIAVHIIKNKRLKTRRTAQSETEIGNENELRRPIGTEKYRNKTAANKGGRGQIARAQHRTEMRYRKKPKEQTAGETFGMSSLSYDRRCYLRC